MLTPLPGNLHVPGVVVSFLACLILIPLFGALLRRTDSFSNTIPPVGGFAFLIVTGSSVVWFGVDVPLHLLVGAVGVGLVGIWDDLSARSARGKTALLLLIVAVSSWLSPDVTRFPILVDVLHALWLLWMCNAFNVLDAVDGLAGGVGAIGLAGLGFLALTTGMAGVAFLCASAAAGLIAYLFHNFHPARVYMGDTGSLAIGFLLGETAFQVAFTSGVGVASAAAVLLVAVPCFEAVFLILIRLAKATMPSVSTEDHPTQRLIRAGLTVRVAVVRMYLLAALLAAAGLAAWQSGDATAAAGALAAGLLILLVTGIRLARVDVAGDGVDGRPGSVFGKSWLVNRIVRKQMHELAGKASGTLVDVGCGGRPYEAIFEPHVDRYVGVDLDAARYGKGDVEVVSESASLPIETASADTVLSNQVIEHVTEPGKAIAEMARILKPGGTAIVTAPHIWGIHEEPNDYYRFTPYGLRYLAEGAGLTVERVDALAGYWVTAGARFCYYLEAFDRGPLKPIVSAANYLVQAVAFVLDHFHRVEGDAWNHVMVAVKPAGDR